MSPKIVNEGEWSLGLVGRTAETIAASTAHLRDDWAMSAKAVASGMFATEIGPDYCPAKEAAKTVASQDPENMHHMWVDLTKLDERKTIAKIDVPMLVCFGEKKAGPMANRSPIGSLRRREMRPRRALPFLAMRHTLKSLMSLHILWQILHSSYSWFCVSCANPN